MDTLSTSTKKISTRTLLLIKALVILFIFLMAGLHAKAFESNTDTISNSSFDIAVANTGISFGNSEKFNGIRFNAVDKGVKTINGLNLTLWKPNPELNPGSVNNGISIGLVSTYADKLNGIGLGTGVGGGQINGMAIGILGAGAERNLNGFVFGGLGAGSGQDLNGVVIGGLGAGSGGDANGLLLGGLGVGASDDINGVFLGGLGAGSGGDIRGIGIGGFGVGAGKNISGIMIGGIGTGCGGTYKGLAFGGLGVGAGEELIGVGLSLGMTKAPVIKGLTISSYNKADETFGLSIAIFNNVKELHGVQLGLINYAGNNRKWLRVLPLINMHL